MTFGPTPPQNIFQGTATLTNGERPFIAGDLSYSYSSFNFGTVLYVADRIDARGDRKARDLALLRALEERYGDCVVYVSTPLTPPR